LYYLFLLRGPTAKGENIKIEDTGMTSSRKRRKNLSVNILRSSSYAHALSDMYWFIFPVLLPLIKEEFGLNYIQAGLLVTSFTIVTGLGSYITGYLGDRFGRRIILSGGFLIASLALMLCSKSSFYWQLLLASALVGAGVSTFHPSAFALLMDLFSKRRGRVLGTFMLWGWIGSAVMLTGVSYLAGRMLAWRQMIFILAWPGLVFAPFFFRSLSFLTKGQNWQDKAEVKPPPLSQGALSLLVIFFTANLALTISFYGVTNFIPTFMVDVKGLPLEKASYFFVLIAMGGMMGAFFSGKLVDRFSSLLVIQIATIAGIPIIFLLTLAASPISLALLLILFGVFYSSVFPPQNVYLADLTSIYVRGKIYGLIQCLSILVGAAAPGIIGLLADHLGLILALQLSTIPLILAGALFYYLIKSTITRA
jgi:MFS family permease